MGEAIGAAYEIISQTIFLVNKSVDDWNQALPEANEFKRDLSRFKLLIDPFVPRRFKKKEDRVSVTPTLVENQSPEEQPLYPTTPPPVPNLAPESCKFEADMGDAEIPADSHLQEMIEEIAQAIAEAGKYVQRFIDDDRRTKSCGSSIKWFFTRLFTSGDYRLYFVNQTARIRLLIGDLMLHQQIVALASKPTIEMFEDDMPVDSYRFWFKHLGKDTVVDWIDFRDAYNMMYGTLEPMDREYMYSVLCSKNDDRVT
ncbi:hypothetical protein BJV82DRAFT_283124 [Fennellomyces sp. T-0311]|nr:hypothetical protein BJV82DRAFT_283124 [Fennellomyces sp. T-0311]